MLFRVCGDKRFLSDHLRSVLPPCSVVGWASFLDIGVSAYRQAAPLAFGGLMEIERLAAVNHGHW